MYHRYWITFPRSERPTPLNLGCGVTAESEQAAIEMVRARIFQGQTFEIERVVEDVSVADLDQGHVVPNMGNPVLRGIWFPLGFDYNS
jgi:hypothetical protein